MSRQTYAHWRHVLHRFQTRKRLPGDEMIRAGKAQVVVFGMGRVGTGAYDYLRSRWGDVVLGIDIDDDYVERHRAAGRNIAHGDATDADFWARAERSGHVKLALLAFSDHDSNMAVAELLQLGEHGPGVVDAEIVVNAVRARRILSHGKTSGLHDIQTRS